MYPWGRVSEIQSIKETQSKYRPEEEKEEMYKFLPANMADHLCQPWQSCANHHDI